MSHEHMPAHVRACLDAIDSIGGDPATVGELVHVLRWLMKDDVLREMLTIAQANALEAVLAKLPQENSNEG